MSAFLFERDFDQEMETEKRSVSDVSEEPSFTLAEVEELRRLAFEEGVAAGQEAGRAEGEARMLENIAASEAETLSGLLPLLMDLRMVQGQYAKAREHDLARMVLFLAKTLLPEIEDKFGARRIEAFCRRALKMAEGDQGLEIVLSPQMRDLLAPKLEGQTTAEGAALRILADEGLSLLSARAQWAAGSAEFAVERLNQELLTTLQGIAQSTAPDGTQA